MEPHMRRGIAPIAATCAWHMGQWDEMASFVGVMTGSGTPETSSGSFLSAVLAVRRQDHTAAKGMVTVVVVLVP